MNNKAIKKLALSAMFIAIGFLLPFLTGQIPEIGKALLPMHIPVFLCALICGWQYGLAVGAVLPLMRSLILSTPPLYPMAIAMTFELAAYGLMSGFIYGKASKKCLVSLYLAMLAAMLGGRIVWGISEVILLGIRGNTFTFSAFISGAVTTAIPGIILQLILIPAIMLALGKTGIIDFHARAEKQAA